MRYIKRKVFLFLCFSFLCFPLYTNVKASEINTYTCNSVEYLPDETNVSINDPWLITFPESITMDKLDGVFVEKESQGIPVLVSVIDNKTLSLRPVTPYDENTTYVLKLFFKDNKKYGLTFTTQQLPHEGIVNQYQRNSVFNTEIIDSETIRIKFDKNVKHEFAENPSNYQIRDEKYNIINNHIKVIKPVNSEINNDTNIYDIVLYKTAGEAKTNGVLTNDPDSESWNLEQSQYNIIVANIPSSGGIVMDKYSFTVGIGTTK